MRKDRTLYLDLELTCEDGPRVPSYSADIIQIGITEVDTRNLLVTRTGNYYVRTAKTISPYCTRLTGITSDLLKREGRPIAEVFNSIRKKFGPSNKMTYTWGDDGDLIEWEFTAREGVGSFFNFTNLATEFRVLAGGSGNLSLSSALTKFNLGFIGRTHDAHDDSWNTAKLHIEMMKVFRVGMMGIREPLDN